MVKAGYIDSSRRGVWTLTEKGRAIPGLTHDEALDLFKIVHAEFSTASKDKEIAELEDEETTSPPDEARAIADDYRQELLETLQVIPPDGFERFCQRLLRESGFQEVTVTGRSGDGGIDGIGILQVNPLVSFKVLFQCKRYKGSVTPSQVRDFRGAMMGRADKGIIITTGSFRWRGKGHHRIEQLKQIHRRHPVVLAWLDCTDCCDRLNELEAEYIEEFQPLLNGTEVPAVKVIPAEVVLKQSLEKIAKYVVIFGMLASPTEKQPTVILKYVGWRRETYNLRRIFKSLNRQPTALRWVEFVRRMPGAWWRCQCNGVALQLGPWIEPVQVPKEHSISVTAAIAQDRNPRPLAGILLPTLSPEAIQRLRQSDDIFAKHYHNLQPYRTDPIPLIWKDFSPRH